MTSDDLDRDLLARLDERVAHLVSNMDWLRTHLADDRGESRTRFELIETRVDANKEEIAKVRLWATIGVLTAIAAALGVDKLTVWIGALTS